jgi:hypothetical protein
MEIVRLAAPSGTAEAAVPHEHLLLEVPTCTFSTEIERLHFSCKAA